MADPKLTLLLQRLHKKTIEDKVPWEKTLTEGVFQASFKGYSVRIFSRQTRNPEVGPEEVDYVLRIYNDEGVLMEEVDDMDFSKDDLGIVPYILMEQIHTRARRTVMGVEKAVNTLLEALGDE